AARAAGLHRLADRPADGRSRRVLSERSERARTKPSPHRLMAPVVGPRLAAVAGDVDALLVAHEVVELGERTLAVVLAVARAHRLDPALSGDADQLVGSAAEIDERALARGIEQLLLVADRIGDGLGLEGPDQQRG